MKNLNVIRDELQKGMYDGRFKEVYVDEGFVSYNRERYVDALDKFKELFGYTVRRAEARYAATIRTTRTGTYWRLPSIWTP